MNTVKKSALVGIVVLLFVPAAVWIIQAARQSSLEAVAGKLKNPSFPRAQLPEPNFDANELHVLPDLSTVSRAVREPVYKGKPRYCLLVFGPRASTRVWLVEDGETLYVDRNANGDLTDPKESFPASKIKEDDVVRDGKQVVYRSLSYVVGDLTPSDGSGTHKQFQVSRYQYGDEPASYIISAWVNRVTLQYAGWKPLFADSREQAPIIHFGGPVVPKLIRYPAFSLTNAPHEVHFCVGTPGLGEHSFAFVGCDAVPDTHIVPWLQIEWPGKAAAPKERYRLAERC